MSMGVQWLLVVLCAPFANLFYDSTEKTHFVKREQGALEIVAHAATRNDISRAVGTGVVDPINAAASLIQRCAAVNTRLRNDHDVLSLGQFKTKTPTLGDISRLRIPSVCRPHQFTPANTTAPTTHCGAFREVALKRLVSLAGTAPTSPDVQLSGCFSRKPLSLARLSGLRRIQRQASAAPRMSEASGLVLEREVFDSAFLFASNAPSHSRLHESSSGSLETCHDTNCTGPAGVKQPTL
jgi:hypothetical protein